MTELELRCRLCTENNANQLDVTKDFQLLSMLSHFFQLKITAEDLLPSTVCEPCYEYVDRMWQFKEQVDRAQILLTELLNNVSTSQGLERIEIIHQDAGEFGIITKIEELEKISCSEESQNHELHGSVESQIGEVLPVCTIVLEEEQKDEQTCKPPKKKIKKLLPKKTKSEESDTFKQIEYANPDGSVVPKPGIGGWNTYQWSCPECNAAFCKADELKVHFYATHDNSLRYVCVDCPKVYSKYSSFIYHVKYHRPFLKFSCDICYKWYATVVGLQEHQTTHYEKEPYQCQTCGKKFRIQSLLTLHTRIHLPGDLKNCYPCERCPKKFATKTNLMAHRRIHLGLKDYTCDQCGKSFVQKCNLENHLLTHGSDRPYQCDICEKSFKSLIRLKKHESIHSGQKPHQCDICGKHFREKGTLKEHHRIHTGVMPFRCEFCGKCFRFKGVLTTHRRQHTGERPYSCTECQHHFTNWPNYNKHMKRRHGINTSVNCRTKQEIPPTGKPNRNPPGTVLAAPQPAPTVNLICQTNTVSLETYSEANGGFYSGIYGISEDIAKEVL